MDPDLKLLTSEDFNSRIDQSERDFHEGKFKASAELKVKYKTLN